MNLTKSTIVLIDNLSSIDSSMIDTFQISLSSHVRYRHIIVIQNIFMIEKNFIEEIKSRFKMYYANSISHFVSFLLEVRNIQSLILVQIGQINSINACQPKVAVINVYNMSKM